MRRIIAVSIALALFPTEDAPSRAQAPDNKTKPALIVAFPLGIVAGKTSKVTLRGLRLDTATEIRIHDPKSTGKLLAKAKSNVPNGQDAVHVGDSQVEVEVTLPADYPMSTLSLSVVTPAGEGPPYRMLVDSEPAIAEKEPNNGFKNAQLIQLPQNVDGVIGQPQDVDVFRFEAKAAQEVVLEVLAARYGSPLDSILTLYNADGQILASNDDHDGSPDSRIVATLPKTGTYHIAVIDANDQGGPAYGYRLVVRAK
jgi:pre-peptidase